MCLADDCVPECNVTVNEIVNTEIEWESMEA